MPVWSLGEVHLGKVPQEGGHIPFGGLRRHDVKIGVFLGELAAAVVRGDVGDEILAAVAAAVEEQDHGAGARRLGRVEAVDHVAVFFLFKDLQTFADLLIHLLAGVFVLTHGQRPVGAVVKFLRLDLQRPVPGLHALDGHVKGLLAPGRQGQPDFRGMHGVVGDQKALACPAPVRHIGIGIIFTHGESSLSHCFRPEGRLYEFHCITPGVIVNKCCLDLPVIPVICAL